VLRLNPAIALAVPVDAVDGTGFEDLLRSKGLAS
jgi:hypothetical protein